MTVNRKMLSILMVLGLVIGINTGIPDGIRAQGPDALVIAQSSDIQSPDPHKTALVVAYNVLTNIYDTLIANDAQMRLKPSLAVSWRRIQPNIWEFKLRQGVKFHNGEPFDASAVKFSFERALDPSSKWVGAGLIRLIESVSVVDPYTVHITTSRPWPILPRFMPRYGWVVPPGYLKEKGDDALTRSPVGTGPYKFVRWIRDDRLELEANSEYWGGLPRIRRIIVRGIPSESTRVAELLAGSVHLINLIPAESFDPVRRSPRLKLVTGPSLGVYVILFNLVDVRRDSPLADKRVRQAVNYAVDRKAIIRSIMRGLGAPIATYCTELTDGCDMSIEPYPFNPERSRSLLREAGYSNGFDMTITTPSGCYPGDRDINLAVADQLTRVGIRTRVVVLECGIHAQQLINRKVIGDATFSRYTDWVGSPGLVAFQAFHNRGGYSVWDDQKMAQLLETADITVNEARRKELYRLIQLRVKDEAPLIPLFTSPNAYGMHRDLQWTPLPNYFLRMFDAAWK